MVNHVSSKIFLRNQVSLRVGETLQTVKSFEQEAASYGVKITSYRSDNFPFNSYDFINHIESNFQTIDFSGVGAHHQNAVAERAIQTVTSWARTMMLQAVIMWPDQANLELWPLALDHAVYLWNNITRKEHVLSPEELFQV